MRWRWEGLVAYSLIPDTWEADQGSCEFKVSLG